MSYLLLVGRTLDLLGKVMISYTAISVHHRFWKEHKIDDAVFRSMKKEQRIGIAGIIFMVVGYLLEILSQFS